MAAAATSLDLKSLIRSGIGVPLGVLAALAMVVLPLPPLDGSSVIMLCMPEETARRYVESFLWQPHFRLFGLLIAWQLLSPLVLPALALAVNLLYPGSHYSVN